ncbi:NADPH-dependent F420 reductase [Nocardia araoensis]|uniref:NADPH-dependent F420 reductase n=1 Tax=Nocardia araoensis TaxID=228600 RepID=UPI00031E90FD|nr:NAD(P)-binding domain-containing protein [Nocardia araoensis]
MRIGIIGAGAMARALGGGWSAAGHEVLVGARSSDAATESAAAIGGRAGSIADAAVFGDVVLLALPVPALSEVLHAAGELLVGRTVIDCTNAFAPDAAAPEGAAAFVLTEDAVAERIAAQAPGAHVVKAFNLCAAEVWQAKERVFDDRRLAVPLCGDDEAAVGKVAALAEDLGLRAIPAGGLHRARYLEALSVFTVGLWFAGHDARAMFPPLEAAFALTD